MEVKEGNQNFNKMYKKVYLNKNNRFHMTKRSLKLVIKFSNLEAMNLVKM